MFGELSQLAHERMQLDGRISKYSNYYWGWCTYSLVSQARKAKKVWLTMNVNIVDNHENP